MKKLSQYHIYKRQDGRFTTSVTFKGKRRYVYGKTKKETLENLSRLIDEIQLAKANDLRNYSAGNTTLSEWAEKCVEIYSREYVRSSTYYSYKSILKNHFGELGKKKLNEITNLMIQNHLLTLTKSNGEDELSTKTLTNIRNFISLIFNYAMQNRIIHYNPVKGIRQPKRPPHPTRALTVDEQKRLEVAVRASDRLVMFAVILDLYTGIRRGELLALKWQDINFEENYIFIGKQLSRQLNKDSSVYSSHLTITEPKTASSIRKIFLINELKNELLDYKQKVIEWKKAKNLKHIEEDFLFCSKKNTPIEPRRFYQYYQELLKLADIEDATFHSLRHTFATRCLEAGIDIVSVSKLLGHSDTKVTANTYSHLLPEHQKKEIEKITELYHAK